MLKHVTKNKTKKQGESTAVLCKFTHVDVNISK